jgi:hypothetical protein
MIREELAAVGFLLAILNLMGSAAGVAVDERRDELKE